MQKKKRRTEGRRGRRRRRRRREIPVPIRGSSMEKAAWWTNVRASLMQSTLRGGNNYSRNARGAISISLAHFSLMLNRWSIIKARVRGQIPFPGELRGTASRHQRAAAAFPSLPKCLVVFPFLVSFTTSCGRHRFGHRFAHAYTHAFILSLPRERKERREEKMIGIIFGILLFLLLIYCYIDLNRMLLNYITYFGRNSLQFF